MGRDKIAIDFDGTCVYHDFPEVGKDAPYVVDTLHAFLRSGYKLILNTMRSGVYLDDAVKWFKDRDISLYGVNCDPDQSAWTESPKCYSHFYVDDCAVGCPTIHSEGRVVVDWLTVYALINGKKLIEDVNDE